MPSHKPDQSHRIWSGPGFSATRIENANNQGIGRISRVYKDSMVVIIRLRLGRTPCSAEVNHAWRCNTCLDVVGRRWCRTGVGDFPRMGDLVVMSRGFVGVHRGFTVSKVSPVGGFKGDFHEPRISNVPVGTISARTPDSRKLPRRIRENRHEPGNPDSSPHITHTPPPQSQPPPASTDTDSRLSIGRRF